MKLIINLSLICICILLLMQYLRQPLARPRRLSGSNWWYSSRLLFAFGFALTFVAAFREGFVDTQVYKHLYGLVGSNWDNAFNDTIPIDDYGFTLFMILLNRISPDPQLLVIVTSVITISVYIRVFGQYSQDLPFTLLLYLCLSFMGSMNGIRQVLTGAILTLALPWIRDRKTIRYMLLVLLLSTFHASVLVMIPLYFIISGRRLNWGIWFFLIAVVACFAAPDAAYRVMGAILEDSLYADYLQSETKMGFMRFLVALVPAVLSLLYCVVQRHNRDGENRRSENYLSQRMTDVLINMQIVAFGFTTLALRMVYFARINLYFAAVLPLLLPVTIRGSFAPRSARQVKRIAIMLYLFYHAYQIYSYQNQGYFYDFHLIF